MYDFESNFTEKVIGLGGLGVRSASFSSKTKKWTVTFDRIDPVVGYWSSDTQRMTGDSLEELVERLLGRMKESLDSRIKGLEHKAEKLKEDARAQEIDIEEQLKALRSI